MREGLVQFEQQIATQTPWETTKAPLRLTSLLADRFLGDRLLSWEGFRRYAKYQLLVLVTSLLVIGFFTGSPFALRPSPWDAYSASLWFCNVSIKTARTDPNLQKNPLTPKLIKIYKSIIRVMHRTWAKVGYIVLFFALLVLLDFFIGYLVLALTRHLLRLMIDADPLTMIYVLPGHFLVMAGLVTLFIVIMGIYLVPVLWVGIPFTIRLSMESAYLGIAVALIAFVLGWIFVPGFIKAISILIFSPALVLFFLLIVTLVLWPFRRWVQYVMGELCRRSIAHDKGPLVLIFRILILIATIVVVFTVW